MRSTLSLSLLPVVLFPALACLGLGNKDDDTCADGFVLGADDNCYEVDDDADPQDAPGGNGGTNGGNGASSVTFMDVGADCVGDYDWSWWNVRAVFDTPPTAVIVNVWETGTAFAYSWNEEHILSAPGGGPEAALFEATLQVIPRDYGYLEWEWVPNSLDTLFMCDSQNAVTWSYRAYDANGDLLGCVMTGHDPAEAVVRIGNGNNAETSPADLMDCEVW